MLRFLLKNIFRYRVGVIDKNLGYVFPDKNQSERKTIRNQFYKNFVDVILESIKGLSFDPNKLIDRFRIRNPEILKPYFEQGQHVIMYSQHYNNWEWGPICLGLQIEHHIKGIVKKLSNPKSNEFIVEGRSGNNVSVIYTYETAEYFKTLKEGHLSPQAIVFIADQLPYGKTRFTELSLFGQKTKFHLGAAAYACEYDLPVFSFDVHRMARGRYELDIIPLCLKPGDESPESLTATYAAHLEQLIKKSPASWLWSHKRFKGWVNY